MELSLIRWVDMCFSKLSDRLRTSDGSAGGGVCEPRLSLAARPHRPPFTAGELASSMSHLSRHDVPSFAPSGRWPMLSPKAVSGRYARPA
eukprot:2594452-Prymnesium_polylepis.1